MSFLRFFSRGVHAPLSPADEKSADSVQTLRQHTRHRLIGTAVLVFIGVVGFPLLFDTQPRPVSVDIAIEIPNKNSAPPLVMLPPTASAASAEPTPTQTEPVPAAPVNVPAPTAAVVAVPQSVPTVASLDAHEEVVSPAVPVSAAKVPVAKAVASAPLVTQAVVKVNPPPQAEPKAEPKSVPKPTPKAEPKLASKTEVKTESKAASKAEPKTESKSEVKKSKAELATPASKALPKLDDGARAAALLEGKSLPVARTVAAAPSAKALDARLVVQVGAFSEVAKAREVRLKLEKAGLKTYSQVLQTKEGQRIRVRVGPFTSRAQADKAAERAKALGLTPSVLAL